MVKNKYKRINWLRALDLELVLASFGILKNSYNEYIVNGEAVSYTHLDVYKRQAQWIEHPPPKGRVTRSIRVGGTLV